LFPPISDMFIAEVHHGWPRSASNQPSQADSNFGNGSGPLFTIYSKIAEKDDDKRVERWQRDAQGILIFVSPPGDFRTALLSTGNSRLASSLSSSRYWSPCRFKTSGHAHGMTRRFISKTSISFSPTQTYIMHRTLPLLWSHHPPSLPRDTPFGSTHYGS